MGDKLVSVSCTVPCGWSPSSTTEHLHTCMNTCVNTCECMNACVCEHTCTPASRSCTNFSSMTGQEGSRRLVQGFLCHF